MENQEQEASSNATVDQERQALLGRRQKLITVLVEATEQNRPSKMTRAFQRLKNTNEFLAAIERIEAALPREKKSSHRRYAVSSLFLHECFKLLVADSDEQFFFLTGAVVDGVSVISERLELLKSKRGFLGVTGDKAETHRLLIKLEQFGHRLLAHFHSHPGRGFEATQPSGTDTGFQKRLETAGYPAVAAIFSRDGYVRFFRLDDDLEIEVYGTGVKRHGKNSFYLTALS